MDKKRGGVGGGGGGAERKKTKKKKHKLVSEKSHIIKKQKQKSYEQNNAWNIIFQTQEGKSEIIPTPTAKMAEQKSQITRLVFLPFGRWCIYFWATVKILTFSNAFPHKFLIFRLQIVTLFIILCNQSNKFYNNSNPDVSQMSINWSSAM